MKKLSYLKQAYEAQETFKKYKDKGISKREIFNNYVAEVVHVCYNTFSKMLKEDVSDYPRLAQEYKNHVREAYQNYLEKRSRKRVK